MGMFDSVYVACPRCGASTEFQSKAGECSLSIYSLDQAPPEILTDLYERGDVDIGERCPKCGHHFWVKRPSEPKKDRADVDVSMSGSTKRFDMLADELIRFEELPSQPLPTPAVDGDETMLLSIPLVGGVGELAVMMLDGTYFRWVPMQGGEIVGPCVLTISRPKKVVP